ncbi:MAG TPA: CHAP domain-containing protein [Chloroflexota bacterium]|nr:CHAP domain-containing protein [Chloroflexota bacterium]
MGTVLNLIGTFDSLGGQCLTWVEKVMGFGPPHWGNQDPTAANAFGIYQSQGAQTFVPQPGDLVFYGDSVSNGFAGHVGIVTQPGWMESIHSNGKIAQDPIPQQVGGSSPFGPLLGYISASRLGITVPSDIAALGKVGVTPQPPTTSGGITNPPGIVGPVGSGIGTIAGQVGSTVGSAAQSAVQTIAQPVQGINAIGMFFGGMWDFMTKRQNWWKLLFLLIAAVLIIVGLKAYFEGAQGFQPSQTTFVPAGGKGGSVGAAEGGEMEAAAAAA